MKQSRRQELKTNELSIFLQQTYATAVRNMNYIVSGLVLVVAVLVLILYVQHRRIAARDNAWNTYYQLQREAGSVAEKPKLLEEVQGLAAKEQSNGELGHRTAELAANTAYDLATSLDPDKDRDKRLTLLKDARSRYQGLIDRKPDSATVERARYSLAKIDEDLLVAGEGNKEQVRSLYQDLAKNEHGQYSLLAAEDLRTLDERISPLNIVATRPAEEPTTQPATAPSTAPAGRAATQPAAAVGPRPTLELPRLRVPPAQPPAPVTTRPTR